MTDIDKVLLTLAFLASITEIDLTPMEAVGPALPAVRQKRFSHDNQSVLYFHHDALKTQRQPASTLLESGLS